MKHSLRAELKPLAPLSPDWVQGFQNPDLEVTLIIPAKNSHHALARTVKEADQFLRSRFGESFEIILVPNPSPDEPQDESTRVAFELQSTYPQVQVRPHIAPRGKGAALRTGFQGARGRWIFFTDADLPYDLSFFDQALEKLKQGYHLVHGNRRLANSQFAIPVRLLKIAYSRHRLGLWFNACVRAWLPIKTTDTQAGIKALSRKLALEFFSRQACPGFLYDLELFLTAYGLELPATELPVTLYLNSEKSTVRILRECILVANWLGRIKLRQVQGAYGRPAKHPILKRFKNAPPLTRLFLAARWWLTPYSRMSAKLPIQGRILDLGCGHGLFSLAAALQSPFREVVALDHDPRRIVAATQAAADLKQIRWAQGDLMSLSEKDPRFSAIAMIDVMHYFEPTHQQAILRKAFDRLDPGGVLLVREVDPQGGLVSRWNRWYEKLATGIGFTRSQKKELTFRTRDDWEALIAASGFDVSSEPCSSPLFADILYVGRKPNAFDH